ncbi:N-acetyl-gamma-glutamyl-phosphate reductase [Ferruginivarius sediminum]|uniref:N-acetyl-gamma-glutamyl-phosphate reductase n=1 Tax=Ferruginivarius sediminum TaxID=2661937 RepID=A0A369T920_9PROT|nr:N-acetyl-gamma-glutamyl-phosphate reductase [Ferruginivarius sediminum]RDD61821.1 N-acetyl-gamma-glutamyl-phosphate reductase [Ferruginivarius sediminum]
MTYTVFIDGEAGTTGLQIRERLAGRPEIQLLSLPDDRRKDREARAELLNRADVAILCLPDEAAREAVELVENTDARVLDASSAHRVNPDWAYGFPEMVEEQAERIANAARVSNPGCYPTGAVSLIRPLMEAGVLSSDAAMNVHAVSGYSGGGRKLIESYEGPEAASAPPYKLYGLSLEHKHVGEMRVHGGLSHQPIFVPSVGRFRQGMIVQVPLHLWALPGRPAPQDIHDVLATHYRGQRFVHVAGLSESRGLKELQAETLNGTNDLRLYVFPNEAGDEVLLCAVLDNLGKGASGAAVQNLNLMLGLPQEAGLESRLAA